MEYIAIFSFLSVAVVSIFTMTSVAVWSANRRREREAFYRHEMLKKLSEMQGAGAEKVIEVMQVQDRSLARRVREAVKLAGLVATAVGAGLLIMMQGLDKAGPVGFIPLVLGLALIIYGFVLAPKDPGPR